MDVSLLCLAVSLFFLSSFFSNYKLFQYFPTCGRESSELLAEGVFIVLRFESISLQ